MPRLRRSDCAGPGITRRRRGRGFSYVTSDGEPVRDQGTLDRIAGLAIPPAWTAVWICGQANGHIQAVGTDAAGRRQYLYHDAWRRSRDAAKHERVLDFADALPAAREIVAKDLRRRSPDRRRTLAAGFRLLDLGSFRIGTEAYATSNGTFGVATLRREHVEADPDRVRFEFPGKGAKLVDRVIRDRPLARALRELLARDDRHPELLAWCDDDGEWHDVSSADLNDYVREVTGGDFTAKDFRTWNATVLMAVALADLDPPATRRGRERTVREAVKRVSDHLNNTPAVARSSYIDRRIVDLFMDDVTIGDVEAREDAEAAVLRMLRSPARRRRQAHSAAA